MDEEFESFVVTDPDIIDEGIDVSGLRTQTDVSPFLLGNIPDYAGIQYEAFNPNRLSDLMRLYSSGLPAIDTPAAAVPPATGGGGGGSGDGGQATLPGFDVDSPKNTPEEQRLIDEGIGVQIGLGDPVVAPGEIPVTQEEMDAFNQIPVTQPVTGGITGDPIEIGIPDSESGFVDPLITQAGASVVSQQLQDEGPTTIEGPLSQVQVDGGLSAIDEERLAGYTPSFDTSGLTDATPEQRNTVQNILAAAGDNVQGALTELGKIPGAIVDFGNQTVDFFGKKLNVGETLAKFALNKIAGGPVSLVFDVLGAILPGDTLEQSTSRNIVNELKAEKDYGFNMQAGNMNQDPFGRNPPAANYEQKLKDDLLGINQSGFQTAKFLEKKQEFAKDYFDKKAEYAGGVEVDEGTVLGPGEAPGDVVSLDDMLKEQRDKKIDEGTQAADDDKGDDMLDTFDTTPADTTNIVDEVALTGGGDGGRDRDPDPSPSFDPGQGFVDQGGGGEFGATTGTGTELRSDPDYGQFARRQQATSAGGGNNSSSSSGKIVCTMMNESYGFGSFRNKIWMKFHKDLSPEYQRGYHKLFLPLVRMAKKNIIVKKVLEHIAVHSTIDMRQSMRGKTHLLGRIYRKILLPLCYWVGRNG